MRTHSPWRPTSRGCPGALPWSFQRHRKAAGLDRRSWLFPFLLRFLLFFAGTLGSLLRNLVVVKYRRPKDVVDHPSKGLKNFISAVAPSRTWVLSDGPDFLVVVVVGFMNGIERLALHAPSDQTKVPNQTFLHSPDFTLFRASFIERL